MRYGGVAGIPLAAAVATLVLTWGAGAAFQTPVRDLAVTPADVTLLGSEPQGHLGLSGAAGDFNGDGVDDLLLGAPGVDSATGEAYIVFGAPGLSGVQDFAQIDPDVRIVGIDNGDSFGASVAAGDFNGDGFDDALIGAPGDDGFPDARSNAGGAYVVFGSATMAGAIEVTGLANRLRVVGATAGDSLGTSVAAGDMNGDGTDDLLIGAPLADRLMPYQPVHTDAGEAYVIYGSPSLGGVFDVAADTPAVRIRGYYADGHLGTSVATGDFAKYGRDGALVGAPFARFGWGDVYGIYTGGVPYVADIANAQYSLLIYGAESGDSLGTSVASGDFNNDGLDDILVGAPGADGDFNLRPAAGEAYVVNGLVLGGGFYTAGIALGEYALRIIGAEGGDQLGDTSVAGDFNGDGRDDVLVSAFSADGQDNSRPVAGEAYVIYGDPGNWGSADLALDAYNARFIGADEDDTLHSLTAGDFNDDGFDDVVLAAPSADGAGNASLQAGDAYIIFGSTPTPTPSPSATLSPSPTVSPTPTTTPTPSHTPTPTPSPQLQGDLNCDGTIDGLDALIAMAFKLGIAIPAGGACPAVGSGSPKFGDVNCDDAVDERDALAILAYAGGVPRPDVALCTPIGQLLTT